MLWVELFKGMRIWSGDWLGKLSRGVILSILLSIAWSTCSLSVLSNNRMFFMFILTVTPTLWSTRCYWTVYLAISSRINSSLGKLEYPYVLDNTFLSNNEALQSFLGYLEPQKTSKMVFELIRSNNIFKFGFIWCLSNR